MRTMLVDHSNRIARARDSEGGYTRNEIMGISGHDAYQFKLFNLYNEGVVERVRTFAGGAPLFAYVQVMHCYLPEQYERAAGGEWPWLGGAERALFEGKHLVVDGRPTVMWQASDPAYNRYHIDPAKCDPIEYARSVADAAVAIGIDGLVVDHLHEQPWDHELGETVLLPDNGLMWKGYQGAFIWKLRQELGPRFPIIANGQWAMEEPGWQNGGLISGVMWERMGSLWHTPLWMLDKIRDRDTTWHIYDSRDSHRSPGWDHETLAKTISALQGGLLGVRNA